MVGRNEAETTIDAAIRHVLSHPICHSWNACSSRYHGINLLGGAPIIITEWWANVGGCFDMGWLMMTGFCFEENGLLPRTRLVVQGKRRKRF